MNMVRGLNWRRSWQCLIAPPSSVQEDAEDYGATHRGFPEPWTPEPWDLSSYRRRLSMGTKVPVEVLPPGTPIPHIEEPRSLPRPRLSRKRLALAFAIAALADGISVFLTLTPPVQWAADLVTAILLFVVLGRQWILLPGLIMEAIPGLYVFPFWVLVVGAVAIWGTARPKLN